MSMTVQHLLGNRTRLVRQSGELFTSCLCYRKCVLNADCSLVGEKKFRFDRNYLTCL